MASLVDKVGTVDYNDIFASSTPTALVATVKVAKSQGVLKRGSLLVGTPGTALSLCSKTATGSEYAYVLADDDVDTTDADVTCFAYKTGNFVRQKLVTNGYTLTDEDYDKLRGIGILTADAATTADKL